MVRGPGGPRERGLWPRSGGPAPCPIAALGLPVLLPHSIPGRQSPHGTHLGEVRDGARLRAGLCARSLGWGEAEAQPAAREGLEEDGGRLLQRAPGETGRAEEEEEPGGDRRGPEACAVRGGGAPPGARPRGLAGLQAPVVGIPRGARPSREEEERPVGGARPAAAANGRGPSRAGSQWAGPVPRRPLVGGAVPRRQPMGGGGGAGRLVWPRGPWRSREAPG